MIQVIHLSEKVRKENERLEALVRDIQSINQQLSEECRRLKYKAGEAESKLSSFEIMHLSFDQQIKAERGEDSMYARFNDMEDVLRFLTIQKVTIEHALGIKEAEE